MKQILIVEDDSFLNKMLAYNLTADGYGVTSALNARSAAAVSYTHLELFLLVTLPKDYINISGNGMKLPFIIPVVRKIFPLCISQFNKPVFFSIEGFHRRNLISGRFFFQCSESCIIKRKLCPVFFVKFILIAALAVVDVYKRQEICSVSITPFLPLTGG